MGRPKPLLTEFGIHDRFESCVIDFSQINSFFKLVLALHKIAILQNLGRIFYGNIFCPSNAKASFGESENCLARLETAILLHLECINFGKWLKNGQWVVNFGLLWLSIFGSKIMKEVHDNVLCSVETTP